MRMMNRWMLSAMVVAFLSATATQAQTIQDLQLQTDTDKKTQTDTKAADDKSAKTDAKEAKHEKSDADKHHKHHKLTREERKAERQTIKMLKKSAGYFAGYVEGYQDAMSGEGTATAGRQEQETSANLQMSDEEEITGVVVRTKKITLKRPRVKHLIAILHTEDDDKHQIVNLGPVRTFKDCKIENGDTLSITGHTVRIGDKSVVFASEVETDEESFTVSFKQPWLDRLAKRFGDRDVSRTAREEGKSQVK